MRDQAAISWQEKDIIMPWPFVTRQSSAIDTYAGVTLGQFGSFALAAIAVFAVTLNAFATMSFSSARLGAVLVILVLLHLLMYLRFLFCREFALYTILLGYMILSLLWTADVKLAMNTVEPAGNFVLILILFGSLVTYHDLRSALAGAFGGFVVGAAVYTFTEGFPFIRPTFFSYNSIAMMYLFGLFITLALGSITRSTVLSLLVGLLLLLHIVATTSIKTNLGILLGATAASLIYFKPFMKGLRRNAILVVAIGGMIAYAVASNDALVERLQAGVDRVALGVEILNARDDVGSYSGFEERTWWMKMGLKGWAENPLLGHGVEAFRSRYEITSHSAPTDLLYNNGLIGFALFYAMFISMAWRLFRARDESSTGLRALILGVLVAFVFATLSGAIHYNTFLALFIAIGTALLRRCRKPTSRREIAAPDPRI